MNTSTKRRSWYVRIALVLAIVLLSSLVAQACTSSSASNGGVEPVIGTIKLDAGQPTSTPEVGQVAPAFIMTIKGQKFTLNDFRGKAVFLNFWASWCPACREEMPNIEAVYQEYKDKDVVFIGVDIRESANDVRQFVKKGGYSWTFAIDGNGAVTNNYGIDVIPASFFLDKNGIIRATSIGAMSKKTIESKLAQAMQ